jgi:DNA-directed RNA polymerase subunit RPC12/RpoP
MDLIKYARLICHECWEMFGFESRLKYITKENYDKQMMQPDKGWRCPDCHTYPCDFDDDYWESNVGIY